MNIFTADEAKKAANHYIVKNLDKCLDNMFLSIKNAAQEGRSKAQFAFLTLDNRSICWCDISEASHKLIVAELEKAGYKSWSATQHLAIEW